MGRAALQIDASVATISHGAELTQGSEGESE